MKQQLKIYAPAVLLVLLGFVVAFQFIKPAPPDRVVIASGGEQGAYFAFAKKYAERLAAEGITLEVKSTAGSVENIALLHAGEVDAALVQGGIEDSLSADNGGRELRSLGSLYYEPLWLFHREGLAVDRLGGLRGLRVAVGGEGSGTRALVMRLLRDNGLTDEALVLLPLGGAAAADALKAGEVDAAFFVSSARSELINQLLHAPGLQLASFERAEAYARRYRFLTSVLLPEGVVDLQANIPARPIHLLAPAANLVVDAEVHPAVIDLLLQAAKAAHSAGDWFEQRGQFPRPDLLAYPLASEAARFYKSGPPFLQRYLPFWAASLIDRLKVMLVPLVLMLLPLVKIMPPLYNWRMRSRVYRWYDELEKIDRALAANTLDIDSAHRELARIEAELFEVNVPLSFAHQLYHLRQHIDLVRRSRST